MKRILTNGLFNLIFEHSETSCGYVERVVDAITGDKISIKHLNGILAVENAINEYLENGIYKEVNA